MVGTGLPELLGFSLRASASDARHRPLMPDLGPRASRGIGWMTTSLKRPENGMQRSDELSRVIRKRDTDRERERDQIETEG